MNTVKVGNCGPKNIWSFKMVLILIKLKLLSFLFCFARWQSILGTRFRFCKEETDFFSQQYPKTVQYIFHWILHSILNITNGLSGWSVIFGADKLVICLFNWTYAGFWCAVDTEIFKEERKWNKYQQVLQQYLSEASFWQQGKWWP